VVVEDARREQPAASSSKNRRVVWRPSFEQKTGRKNQVTYSKAASHGSVSSTRAVSSRWAHRETAYGASSKVSLSVRHRVSGVSVLPSQ